MKKISVIILLMTSVCARTIHASELEKAGSREKSPHGFVLVGEDGQDDLTHALGENHDGEDQRVLPTVIIPRALPVMPRKVAFSESDEPKDESSWLPTVRDCKYGLAGALVGGYAAGLIQDSYGTGGGVVLSILTSAVVVVVSHEKNMASDQRYLLRGFLSGVNVPLAFKFLLRKRK